MELHPTLCFALPFEAAPFLNCSKAKLIAKHKLFHFYHSALFDVLIFGMGKYAASNGVTWLQLTEPRNRIWINIGFAGSAYHQLNTWHLAHTIMEIENSRVIHPEILLTPQIPITTCLTVNQPACAEFLNHYSGCIIDMEAYGFAMAAKNFVPVTQIQVLKFVSDRGADEELDLKKLQEEYSQKIPEVIAVIESWSIFFKNNAKEDFNLDEQLKKISSELRLTYSQQIQLENALKTAQFYGLNKKISSALNFQKPEKLNKTTRNALFNSIVDKLKIE